MSQLSRGQLGAKFIAFEPARHIISDGDSGALFHRVVFSGELLKSARSEGTTTSS